MIEDTVTELKVHRDAAERYAREAVDFINSDADLDCDRIIELYNKSLKSYELSGDKREMANTHSHLAYWHGYKEDSMEHCKKAQRLYEEVGDIPGMATIYCQMAETATCLKDYHGALSYYQKSLSFFERIEKEEDLGKKYDFYIDYSNIICNTGSEEQLHRLAKASGVLEEEGYYHLDQWITDKYSKDSCSIIVKVAFILNDLFKLDQLKDDGVDVLTSAGFEQSVADDILSVWRAWKAVVETNAVKYRRGE